MAEYGVPYQGSKGSICNEIIKIFPKAEHFYDLFGGGFSITHAMMLRRHKDYRHFHFNEIRPGICDIVKDAIDGKYNYNVFKPKWISREEFFEKVDKDTYIKMFWSFGNNGKTYLFSKEIEPYKKSMHNAVIFNEFDDLAQNTFGMSGFKDGYSVYDRRVFLRSKIDYYRKTKLPEFLWPYLDENSLRIVKNNKLLTEGQTKQLQQLQQLERLERLGQLEGLEQLERLERLERLGQLEQLNKLNFYNTSYEKIEIKPNAIIYCDPPYANTGGYGSEFNHKKFLDWCHEQKEPVFISEYNISDKRFHCIKQIKKRSLMSGAKTNLNKVEKVYVNQSGKIMLRGMVD